MKKTSRKLVALLLTLAMILAIGIPGLAAGIGFFPSDDARYNIQPCKHYDTYTVYGDSITAGVNTQDYYHYYNADGTYTASSSIDWGRIAAADHWDNGDERRVEGTYPALVEDYITADKVNHLSHIGYRTDELRILLDDSYYGDDLTPTLLNFLGATYGINLDGWMKNRTRYQQAAVDADIITMGIGSNDVLMTIWFNAIGLLYGENASLGTITNGINQIAQSSNSQNATDLLSAVLSMLNGLYGTTKTLAELANALLEAEVDFRTNFKAITDKIYELNPDVDLYVIGVYNGAKEIKVSSDIGLQVGKLGDAAFLAINNYMANLCPNRNKYHYVDVWNITLGEAPSLLGIIQNVSLINSLMTVDHPTEVGHAEIAKEIRAQLPKVDEKTETTPKTTKSAETTKATTTTKTTTTTKAGQTTKAAATTKASGSTKTAETSKTEPTRWVKKNPADGKWYCYKGDDIEYTYTGIAKNENGWWRIVDGEVDFNAKGIFKNEYGWWYVEGGKVQFDHTGIDQNQYGWWRVKNGKVDFDANGVYKNQNGWWYVEGGRVDFGFTGIASNENGSWYIKNGKVDFSKNGKVKFQGKTYTIKNGKVTKVA